MWVFANHTSRAKDIYQRRITFPPSIRRKIRMKKRVLIIGSGFAGLDAALSAARLRDIAGVDASNLEICMISPAPILGMRPRLYEASPETLSPNLTELLAAVEVRYVQGMVERVDATGHSVHFIDDNDAPASLTFDKLVVAVGSRLFRPDLPGLREYGHSVDTVAEAVALDQHLHHLASQPDTEARNTVVVAGGGFTGLEIATELPGRMQAILGTTPRIVIVERAAAIGPDIGDQPRPVIVAALEEMGIETRVGSGVSALDATGAVLTNGERIDAATIVWSAGMRANPLTSQIPGEKDALGRIKVDSLLKVTGVPDVFATGDAAHAIVDDDGSVAVMSCQHAKRMGAFAGNNAVADLLGIEPEPYHQRPYVTCLDLGSYGAVLTEGWDRKVRLTGQEAKQVKRDINTVWIYPPRADKIEALTYAVPANVVDLTAF